MDVESIRLEEQDRLLAFLFLFGQFPKGVLGFGGAAIFTGFIILLDGVQNPLNRSSVSSVPADLELARQVV